VQEKQEKIACTKKTGETLNFRGPMTKTQLLKIIEHHVIAFDKKSRR
jgi:hypothetical protein